MSPLRFPYPNCMGRLSLCGIGEGFRVSSWKLVVWIMRRMEKEELQFRDLKSSDIMLPPNRRFMNGSLRIGTTWRSDAPDGGGYVGGASWGA